MTAIITIVGVRVLFKKKTKGEKLSPTEIKMVKQYLKHVEKTYKKHHEQCCKMCQYHVLYKEAETTIGYLLS